ncbi:MAG: PrsW family intramembrane metalloprotease [Thermoguttaceae bacterium]
MSHNNELSEQRWYLGSPSSPRGPFPEGMIRQGILDRKIATTVCATEDGQNTWRPLVQCKPFIEVCASMSPNNQTINVDTGKLCKEKVQQILKEFRETDFKNEIIPIDASNLSIIAGDVVFWVVLTLGVLPLLIISINDPNMQLVGMLFFFAMLWGGIFRSLVLKSSENVGLPISAFFFTGIIGVSVLLLIYQYLPAFYTTMADSPNPIICLAGFVFQVGTCEELCKIVPVVLYLFLKRQKASPMMIVLIGVFSGLGFSAFENIGYSDRMVAGTVEHLLHGQELGGIEGALDGAMLGTREAMIIIMLRSVSCVFAHAIWSGVFSCFIAMAFISNRRWFALIFIGFAVSAVTHGFYDWCCAFQQTFGAITIGLSFLLFYGYLSKIRILINQHHNVGDTHDPDNQQKAS